MSAMGGGMGVNQLFREQRIFEEKVVDKFIRHQRALWHMRKDEDKQLTGLLKDLPPDPKLTRGKVYLRYVMAIARSHEWKTTIAFIIRFIVKPSLDMFKKEAIMIESYWKDEPTDPGEQGMILAPGKIVGDRTSYEERFMEEEGISEDIADENKYAKGDRTESPFYDEGTRMAFTGPSGERLDNEEDLL